MPYVSCLLRVTGSCNIHFVLNTHVLSTIYAPTTSVYYDSMNVPFRMSIGTTETMTHNDVDIWAHQNLIAATLFTMLSNARRVGQA
jgi:hypothetical protein